MSNLDANALAITPPDQLSTEHGAAANWLSPARKSHTLTGLLVATAAIGIACEGSGAPFETASEVWGVVLEKSSAALKLGKCLNPADRDYSGYHSEAEWRGAKLAEIKEAAALDPAECTSPLRVGPVENAEGSDTCKGPTKSFVEKAKTGQMVIKIFRDVVDADGKNQPWDCVWELRTR